MNKAPAPRRFGRIWRTSPVAAVLVCTLGGCGFTGLYSAHLPGSVSGGTYTVSVYFDNVLDLVPQSAVRVNDVNVGTVEAIRLVADPVAHAYRAKVVCVVKRSVHLPANSVAILEETSLLGEKFVELAPPATGSEGTLADGAVITDGSTTAYPDVEEVFGVLASVLNGGGLEKLQTINFELTQALSGREQQVRDVLTQLTTFVSGLATQKAEINRAIDGLDRLSGDLAAQDQTIATALDDLGPGIKVLADQRSQLVALLQGLSRLGVVSSRIINASVHNTQADLTLLEPVLTRLNQAGRALPNSFELLLDYPFPRSAANGILGDYTSLYATVNAGSVCQQLPSAALCSLLGTVPLPLPQGARQSSSPAVAPPSSVPSRTGSPIPVPVVSTPPLPAGGVLGLLGMIGASQ